MQPDRRREQFSRLPAVARVFVGGTVVLATGLLASHAVWPGGTHATTFVALLATACVVSRFNMRLPAGRANLSASFFVDFLSLLLLGPHPTIIVAAAGATSQSLLGGTRHSSLHRTLFNVACFVITIEATGLAYITVGGTFGRLTFPGAMAPVAAAALVYFLVNSGLVALAVSTSTAQAPLRVWREAFLWSGPNYFVGATVTAAGLALAQSGHWLLLPLAALPLYLTYQGYAAYASRLEYEHRHREIIESLSEGMAVIDRDGQVTLWNDALERMAGCARASALGRPLLSVVGGPASGRLEALIRLTVTSGTAQTLDDLRLRRGEAARVFQVRAFPYAGGTTLFWNDVTERVRAEVALRHAALHDTLTGLPNRKLFVEQVDGTIAGLNAAGHGRCAVMFIDIDRFKVINDSLGHQAGDELLRTAVRRLQGCLRAGDTLARMGGDEFTVLLQDVSGLDEAVAMAERIQREMRIPIELGAREVAVSASIGIALNRPDHRSADDIMRDADIAMYRAKEGGRARYEVFDAALHAQVIDKLGFENDLRRAVEQRELTLSYQPIVSLGTGDSVGFEALIRWHRGGTEVNPADFIPVAEELGLIEPLGSWVLHTVCAQFAEWRRRRPGSTIEHVTVNVSAHQLVRPGFVDVVRQAVGAAGIEPRALHLEITETALLREAELVVAVLQELRAFGVKIYLDDFGTGFSSLSHLHRLPVDALKLDRAFVSTLLRADRPAIVESVLALAHTLGTPVIAEGVETEAQLRELARLGCASAQGYFFSGPLPPAGAEAFMAGSQLRAQKQLGLGPQERLGFKPAAAVPPAPPAPSTVH